MPRELPSNIPPRGLAREQAAAYVGLSPNSFDLAVAEGRLPQPIRFNRRAVWDRLALDRALDIMSGLAAEPDAGGDPFSEALDRYGHHRA